MKVLQLDGFIVFSDVTKTLKSGSQSYTAIRGVTLSVRRGYFTMLLGQSGCGKSTLLNLTAGLFGPSQGAVTYDGAPVGGLNHRVAYMTQQDHLLPWRTVSGNVSLPLEVAGLAKRDREARVKEFLSLVGLRDFAKSYPNQISSGILGRPRILADILAPFLTAIYSLPKVAMAPLFVLWFGIGIEMKIVLAAVTVFFLVFLNTYTGVRSVSREQLTVIRLMGASERQLVLNVPRQHHRDKLRVFTEEGFLVHRIRKERR